MKIERIYEIFSKTDELYNIINENISDKDMARKLCTICLPKDIIYADIFRNNYYNKDSLETIKNSGTKIEKLYVKLVNDNIDLKKFRKVASKYRYLKKEGYLVNYFRKNLKDSGDIVFKLENLKTMCLIINSDKSDIEKANLLKNICNSLMCFRMNYTFIIKDNDNCSIYDDYKMYIDNFDTVLKTYIKYTKLKLFNTEEDNYKNVIKEYINSDLILDDFLKEKNIDRDYFNSCVVKARDYYYNLYQKYEVKKIDDNKKKFVNTKEKIDELIFAVNSNKFSDDTPLSVFEFIKRSPFRFDTTYYSEMNNFLDENYTFKQSKKIREYLTRNKFNDEYLYKKITIEDLLKIKTIINNRELTIDDYNVMFNYLNSIGITTTNKTVSEVKKLYLKGLIK